MRQIAPSAYANSPSNTFLSPFTLRVDPIDRLLLVDFSKNPDALYHGFEIQAFADDQTGQGLLVIAARRDGRADVYHMPGLNMDKKDFNVVGKGLHKLQECPFDRAQFEIHPTGVQVDVSFQDLENRPIRLSIREEGGLATHPFNLLAPLGAGSKNPPSLPLVILFDFTFVRRKGTQFIIEINGRLHSPDTLPLRLNGQSLYFTRYAADPFPVFWNEAREGPLSVYQPEGPGRFQTNGAEYELVDNHGRLEIAALRAAGKNHQLPIRFDPPIPDLAALAPNTELAGRFTIDCGPRAGRLTGTYALARRKDSVDLRVHPCGGWQPREKKLLVKALYLVAPMFRTWPKSYLWNARLNLKNRTIQSGWQRKK